MTVCEYMRQAHKSDHKKGRRGKGGYQKGILSSGTYGKF